MALGDNHRETRRCATCRARKIRCDGRGPTCGNCERLGLRCAGFQQDECNRSYGRSLPASQSTAGLKRKRTYHSCQQCRSSKLRCSGDEPACSRCVDKALPCNYERPGRPSWMKKLAVLEQPDRPSSDPIEVGSPVSCTSSRSNTSEPTRSSRHQLSHYIMPPNDDEASGRTQRAVVVDSAQVLDTEGNFPWLFAGSLPKRDLVLRLIESYFANIHPLRCFAFIHKPTFLQQLDSKPWSELANNALVHIMCALSAPFHLLAGNARTDVPHAQVRDAGSHWARHAQQLVLADIDVISNEKLMTMILLHEHSLRQGRFANAFMLSGMAARMAQALQINLEHSTDVLCCDTSPGSPTVTDKESRRRVMWSVYIQDTMVGSGVDQLMLVNEQDIKVQLPCDERSFVMQRACVTELLEPKKVLNFLATADVPQTPTDNMGLTAFYLRHMHTRKKVLRHIKRVGDTEPPWLTGSEFARLDRECQDWYQNLPTHMQWTKPAIYIRREFTQVGALVALHLAYHQTMCDLYRIGARDLFNVRGSLEVPPAQKDFMQHVQETLFTHARRIASISSDALEHGMHAVADTWLPTIIYDSIRIILYYLTQLVDPGEDAVQSLTKETLPLIQRSIDALQEMRYLFTIADPLTVAARTMLDKTGIASQAWLSRRHLDRNNSIVEHPYTNNPDDVEPALHGKPAQTTPDYHLNPLSIYRMARRSIPEKHAPETVVSPPAAMSASAQKANPQTASAEYDAAGGRSTANDGVYQPSTTEQASFDELQWLFNADPGWTWQPGDTAITSLDASSGLPPWQSGVPNTQDQYTDLNTEADWTALFPLASAQ